MSLYPLAVWGIASALLTFLYALVVERYRLAWLRLSIWDFSPNFSPATKISVLIPARNEAANILACLEAVVAQSYPKHLMEVIVVDDGSSDGTFSLVQHFSLAHPQFQAIRLEANGGSKKKAIEKGIATATGELVVCTDADCLVPTNWLWLLASMYQEKKAKFIAAPVQFKAEKNKFQRFQSLDLLGMMGVTGSGFQSGSGLLCNGANLAYPKSVFLAVGGFEGIDGLASGDDMLLLHKIAKQYPQEVFFLKNHMAAVTTKPQPNLSSFIDQRIRWASKSRTYEDFEVIYRLLVAYVFCWAILGNAILSIWWAWPLALLALGMLAVKTWVDYRFLGTMAGYFERKDLLKGYWYSQLMHISYIITIGTMANLVREYEWKGRRVR